MPNLWRGIEAEWKSERDRRLAAEAENERLRAKVAAVEALTGGPFSDGYRPYAVEVNGEVVLAVGLDDLRAALASGDDVHDA